MVFMDLASTEGKNVGWATLKLSQSLMMQWLALFQISCQTYVYVNSDIAGILLSWGTPNPSRVEPVIPTCLRILDVVFSVPSTAIKRKPLSYIWAASSRCVGHLLYLLAFSCGYWNLIGARCVKIAIELAPNVSKLSSFDFFLEERG